MRLGLVILNYNDAKRTTALAQKAAAYDGIDVVCIVDNCSTDDSMAVLRGAVSKLLEDAVQKPLMGVVSKPLEDAVQKPLMGAVSKSLEGAAGVTDAAGKAGALLDSGSVYLLESGRNGGYAAGNNLGCRYVMEQCGCDVLLIANPDVDFTDDTVQAIRSGFLEHPEYGVLGPMMHNPDGTRSNRPYLQIPTFWQGVGLCFYSYNRWYEKRHPYDLRDDGGHIMTVDAVQGSLWAVRADAFRRAGGLDEGTFLFYEEMAFAMRVREKCPEYREGLLLNASYLHNHSASIRSSLSQMRTFRIYMQSKLYFEKTYHGAGGIRYAVLKTATMIARLEERLFLMLHSPAGEH